jgi:hypothetical protein
VTRVEIAYDFSQLRIKLKNMLFHFFPYFFLIISLSLSLYAPTPLMPPLSAARDYINVVSCLLNYNWWLQDEYWFVCVCPFLSLSPALGPRMLVASVHGKRHVWQCHVDGSEEARSH